jgi:Spy/CpxP family protein refolding chaperone
MMNNKHLGIIVGISVLLNAFLGGLVLSNFLPRDHVPFARDHKGGPPPMEEMMLNMIIDQSGKLSEDGHHKVEKIAGKYREIILQAKQNDPHQIFSEIHATMMAENFDKTKAEQLHKKINTAESKLKESIGNMMIEIAGSLSKEDRLLFFKDILAPHPPDFHGDKDRHGEGPPPEDYPDEDFSEDKKE